MREYMEFLMFELGDVISEKETDDERVNEILVTLSASDGPIPETFYRLYTCNIGVDSERLMNALAYFTGIGEIEVQCDCDPEWKSICEFENIKGSNFYKFGLESVGKSPEWYNVRCRVKELYADLWS